MTPERAKGKFDRALLEALGMLDLAKLTGEPISPGMRRLLSETLSDVADDDELIDALYDADMREERTHGH